jgi:adenylate cyclase
MMVGGMNRLRQIVQAAPQAGAPFPAWIERLTTLGIVSRDPLIVRRQRFTNMFVFASAANIVAHIGFYAFYDLSGLLPLILLNAAFAAAMLAVPVLHRWGANAAANAIVILSIVAILSALLLLGRESQLYVYLALAGTILFLFGVEYPRAYLPWFAVAAVSLLVSLPFTPDHGLLAASDPRLQRVVSFQAMINVAVVNTLIIYFVLSTLRRTELALEDQYARAAALTSSLLPDSVVERLTAAPDQRIADRIDGLSVLFADLAGFTNAARALPPEEVVEYLDDLVRSLDALCAEHGVEKIKTIGDCYMAVGGLAGDRAGGARAVGRFALALLAVQQERPPLGTEQLAFRIGLHHGGATAGIIGDTRFTYDVWGDAVNVAARMESHGVPGRIHVSEAFREAAGDAFVYEERGEIDIKSIGRTRTYLLTGTARGVR